MLRDYWVRQRNSLWELKRRPAGAAAGTSIAMGALTTYEEVCGDEGVGRAIADVVGQEGAVSQLLERGSLRAVVVIDTSRESFAG